MVRWDDYCQDPLALGRMCQENPSCCPLPAGFYWHHVIDQACRRACQEYVRLLEAEAERCDAPGETQAGAECQPSGLSLGAGWLLGCLAGTLGRVCG